MFTQNRSHRLALAVTLALTVTAVAQLTPEQAQQQLDQAEQVDPQQAIKQLRADNAQLRRDLLALTQRVAALEKKLAAADKPAPEQGEHRDSAADKLPSPAIGMTVAEADKHLKTKGRIYASAADESIYEWHIYQSRRAAAGNPGPRYSGTRVITEKVATWRARVVDGKITEFWRQP